MAYTAMQDHIPIQQSRLRRCLMCVYRIRLLALGGWVIHGARACNVGQPRSSLSKSYHISITYLSARPSFLVQRKTRFRAPSSTHPLPFLQAQSLYPPRCQPSPYRIRPEPSFEVQRFCLDLWAVKASGTVSTVVRLRRAENRISEHRLWEWPLNGRKSR